MRPAARTVCLVASLVLAALAGSGLLVVSRSELADNSVHRIARVAAAVVPRGRAGPFVPPGASVGYPVIERLPLRGHADASNGAPVPPAVVWWRETASPDRVVPLFIVLLLAAAAHGLLAIRWAWPGVRSGRAIVPGRLAVLVLTLGAWSAPVAGLCLFLYWPLVSLWGTIAYVAVDQYGASAWVWDATPTRAMIGAGLFLCFSSSSMVIARRRINVMIAGGALSGVLQAPADGVCRECGYVAPARAGCCPECGRALSPERRVAFIWPRALGTPTRARRRRSRVALVAVSLGLLSSPLLAGVVKVLVGGL